MKPPQDFDKVENNRGKKDIQRLISSSIEGKKNANYNVHKLSLAGNWQTSCSLSPLYFTNLINH